MIILIFVYKSQYMLYGSVCGSVCVFQGLCVPVSIHLCYNLSLCSLSSKLVGRLQVYVYFMSMDAYVSFWMLAYTPNNRMHSLCPLLSFLKKICMGLPTYIFEYICQCVYLCAIERESRIARGVRETKRQSEMGICSLVV